VDVETVRAGWLTDPSGRHEHRYWDGSAWTEHVADAGRQGVDPAPAGLVSPAPAGAAWLADPSNRHEYRYWDGSAWTEHVADDGRERVDPPPAALVPAIAGARIAPPTAVHTPAIAGSRGSTSGFAIASMVLGILWMYWVGSILALVFGYIALHRIKASAGYVKGRGMAIAGVVLGWVGIALLALTIVLATTTHVLDVHKGPNGDYCSNNPESIFPRC